MIKEKEQFISLKFDLLFKKVFGSEEDLIPIKKLLKEVLEIVPKDIKILNSELVGRPYKDRSVRVDLVVELEDETKINIEINTVVTQTLIERNVYYMCRNMSMDVSPKRILGKINRHIQINMDYSGNHKAPITRYTLYDKDTKDELTNMLQIIRIYIPYFREKCYNKDVEKLDSKTKFLGLFGAESIEEVRKLCSGDEMMEDIGKRIDKYNDDLDVIGLYHYKFIEEEVKQEQLEEATKEGISEGIELTAKNLLKENMDINFISKVTGLSLKEIEKLKES